MSKDFTIRTRRGSPQRTKVVSTLGPACDDPGVLRAMVAAGINVARLNFSHGTEQDHRRRAAALREASNAAARHVAIMCDLSGPKIRLGEVEGGAVDLATGKTVEIVRGDGPSTAHRLTANYAALVDDVTIGEPVFIDDGAVRLRVESKTAESLICKVEQGGEVKSRKGINLPGTGISTPSLTEKDIADLEIGVSLGADLFALSFVRSAADVTDLRARLNSLGSSALIVAKIEKPQALDRLDEIIAVSDAIMVARGDLGIEMPVESVPLHQKRIVRACHRALKPVIVATQVLESMVQSPYPTRAEVSDIANAIEDGCDALMLSAETAVGEHPLRAVETMVTVARDVERDVTRRSDPKAFIYEHQGEPVRKAMVMGAVMIAEPLEAKFIVVRSESGETARYLSKVRGLCPVLAANTSPETLRRHALLWGVVPVLLDEAAEETTSLEEALPALAAAIARKGLVDEGDRLVVVGSSVRGDDRPPDSIRTMRIGSGDI